VEIISPDDSIQRGCAHRSRRVPRNSSRFSDGSTPAASSCRASRCRERARMTQASWAHAVTSLHPIRFAEDPNSKRDCLDSIENVYLDRVPSPQRATAPLLASRSFLLSGPWHKKLPVSPSNALRKLVKRGRQGRQFAGRHFELAFFRRSGNRCLAELWMKQDP
jgi:hypothetical protein